MVSSDRMDCNWILLYSEVDGNGEEMIECKNIVPIWCIIQTLEYVCLSPIFMGTFVFMIANEVGITILETMKS